MVSIPKDATPTEVAEALATYVVEHSELTGRYFSSIREEVQSKVGPRVLELVMAKHEQPKG